MFFLCRKELYIVKEHKRKTAPARPGAKSKFMPAPSVNHSRRFWMPCRNGSGSDFISAAMTKTNRMSNRTEAVGQAVVFVTKILQHTVQQFIVAS